MRRTGDRFPHSFSIEATGDFEGTGEWRLRQDGEFVDLTYDWKVPAEKPLLRALSFVLKPIFAANHRWAMRQGEPAAGTRSAELEPAVHCQRGVQPA